MRAPAASASGMLLMMGLLGLSVCEIAYVYEYSHFIVPEKHLSFD